MDFQYIDIIVVYSVDFWSVDEEIYVCMDEG